MSEAAPAFGYQQFGRHFFELAVTEQRVLDALAGVSGRPVEIGPVGVGPGRLVRVRATGRVGLAQVAVVEHEHVAFHVRIPVELALVVDLGLEKSRFSAQVLIHLFPVARPEPPLLIQIDIEPPTPEQIEVAVQPDGAGASLLHSLAKVDREIAKAVAKYVAGKLDEPDTIAARTIDVAAVLRRRLT